MIHALYAFLYMFSALFIPVPSSKKYLKKKQSDKPSASFHICFIRFYFYLYLLSLIHFYYVSNLNHYTLKIKIFKAVMQTHLSSKSFCFQA